MIVFSTQLYTAHTTHLHAQIVLRHVYVCLQSVHLQVLHVLQVALGASDWSGTQTGDVVVVVDSEGVFFEFSITARQLCLKF